MTGTAERSREERGGSLTRGKSKSCQTFATRCEWARIMVRGEGWEGGRVL